MTDGWPGYYVDNSTGAIRQSGDGWSYNKKSADEATESANKIKNSGINMYTIGFGLSGNNAKTFMEGMANPTEYNTNGSIKKKYYYETSNQTELNNAFDDIFESITTSQDLEKIKLETTNGKTEITSGFAEGQKAEIYVGEYTKGMTPLKTYTWQEFIGLKYTTYDATNKKITFELGTFMRENNILPNALVNIRFVK